jgi:hypothetical protein
VRIAVDDTYVYWSNNLGGAIVRARKNTAGASAETVVAGTSPTSFAIAGDRLYFPAANRIDQVSKSGGASTPFITLEAGIKVVELAGDNSTLYAFSTGPNANNLWRVDLATVTSTKLGSTLKTGRLVLDNVSLSYRDGQNLPSVHVIGRNGARDYVYNLNEWYNAAPAAFVMGGCGLIWSSSSALYLSRPGSSYAAPLVNANAKTVLLVGEYIYWADSSGAIGRIPAP